MPPELPIKLECTDELRNLSLSRSASFPTPLPRPSRRDSTPVSSPEHRRISFIFPRVRRKRFGIYESLTVGPTVRFLNISESFFCLDFLFYFSSGNWQK